jgi:hypothetical protein
MGGLAPRGDGGDSIEGVLLGVDQAERQTAEGIVRSVLVSLLTDEGEVRSFDLLQLGRLEILDPGLRRDLDFYLRTQLSAKKKDARTFTFFAQGTGRRTVRLSYTIEAPVWKATYRILLGEEGKPPLVQGWAVVDNTQDEDWENVRLSLIAGLPVSFVHDLYTPRYVRRPVVAVQETTGVLPPEVEQGVPVESFLMEMADSDGVEAAPAAAGASSGTLALKLGRVRAARTAISSMPAQVRERKLGDLFEYEIEHPVTIRRNQSALVPIVFRPFEDRPVLLYQKAARAGNPLRSVEFKNTTGLTLEGGPVTVLEAGSYVGEAMLDTLRPDQQRLVPYAVELSVHVLDNIDSHDEDVYRISYRRGQVLTHYTQQRQTTYTFDNQSDGEHTLYLDHPRLDSDWELFDTAQPYEITENTWRFRLTLPARRATAFVVRQKQSLSRITMLSDLSEEQLGFWLRQRFLDRKTADVLRRAAEVRQQAADLDRKLKQLDEERDKIHKEQERVRQNLKALGDRPAEKELRERLVRSLNTQEDRLEALPRERQEQQAARDRCWEQIKVLVAALEESAGESGT